MKFTKTGLGIALALGISLAASAAEVEVLHYWTSGGEAKSAAELKRMLEEKGHDWKDFAVAGGGGESAMTVLKSRVVSGTLPLQHKSRGPVYKNGATKVCWPISSRLRKPKAGMICSQQ